MSTDINNFLAYPPRSRASVMRELDSIRLQFNDIFTYSASELNHHKFSFENAPCNSWNSEVLSQYLHTGLWIGYFTTCPA